MERAQSAMEYLMTYGWAILIIAVVLGVMFQLGVFSGGSLTPKTQSGACQVQRLLGQTSLEGECNGQLPQSVAGFTGNPNLINLGSGTALAANQMITGLSISAWFYMNEPATIEGGNYIMGAQTQGYLLRMQTSNQFRYGDGCGHSYTATFTPNQGTWYNIVATITSNSNPVASIYINGAFLGSAQIGAFCTYSGPTCLGSICANGGNWQGYLANIQMYNTSLSYSEVNAIYYGGIGGAPVRIQNLIGWWPLNGDAKDYSGNNDNGAISGGVYFNTTWQSAYTPP